MSTSSARETNHTAIKVVSFYKFAPLVDHESHRVPLLRHCLRLDLKGTILLAAEGINATIAGAPRAIDALLDYLRTDMNLADLDPKVSWAGEPPFFRMKVRAKNEIVTMGVPGVDPTRAVGTYIEPEDWNQLIADPSVLVIDVRNTYETRIGSFETAIDPNTESFRQFPDFVKQTLDPGKHKKVALFCTGGIRCEKATSYLLDQGFENVFHLRGGILNYLDQVPKAEQKWTGDCFVFDQRVSVDAELAEGTYHMCHACRTPLTEADRQHADYKEGITCPHCAPGQSAKNKARAAARQKQIELADKRGGVHLAQKATKPETNNHHGKEQSDDAI